MAETSSGHTNSVGQSVNPSKTTADQQGHPSGHQDTVAHAAYSGLLVLFLMFF
jgi:hypothetical protein